MTNLIPFNYNSKQVRTEVINNEPWFVARDIADVLGISDTRTITDRLDSDECGKTTVTDNIGREQEAYIISESGLYEAISRSNKPEAKEFQRWVRKDVLPSIRKHGMYAKDELLDNPDLMIEVLQTLKKEREEKKLLQSENNLLSQQTLTWANRKLLDAIIKKYGASIHIPDINGFQQAWSDFKKELLYAHSININSRVTNYMNNSGKKTKPPVLDMIHDEELPKCISTATALCRSHGVDISDIIAKYQH